jgi:hypothetical protein
MRKLFRRDKKLVIPIFILLISFFILNFLDVISTYMFLNYTRFKETNPFFQQLNNNDFLFPVIVKLFLLPFFLLSFFNTNKFGYYIMNFVNIFYIFVIINNISTFFL